MRMVVFDDISIQTLLVFLRLTWNIVEFRTWKDVAFVVCFLLDKQDKSAESTPTTYFEFPVFPPPTDISANCILMPPEIAGALFISYNGVSSEEEEEAGYRRETGRPEIISPHPQLAKGRGRNKKERSFAQL